ncbi:MAG: polyprenol phosphomannose-dependent alpha 1,6 mannosyltransferase MptB [Solirubrobacteraceae bacterium]
MKQPTTRSAPAWSAPGTELGLAWPALGLAGSGAVALGATRLLARRPIRWWWTAPLPGGHGTAWHVFWVGVIALCMAWLGVGNRIRAAGGGRAQTAGGGVRPREVLILAALWAVPLALGPALFSLDMYSYLAQGSLLHHGLDPYTTAPIALTRWHETAILSAVSSRWRHTTAPYGPIFMAISGVIAGVAGDHPVLGVMLERILELFGLGLLAVSVPRLARALRADATLAVWLALCSPVTLLYLVGGGHNDALMAGLLVAGVTLALERRPLLAIGLCSLAATIKLPALAAVPLIAACWWRCEPQRWRRIVAASTTVCAGVLLGAGLLTQVGVSWISGSALSSSGSARIVLTPSTDLAVSLADVLRGAGIQAASASLQATLAKLAIALVALGGLWLCTRVSYERLATYLGALLLAAALGGPAAWPWYLCWGATLLCADARAQRSLWLPALLVGAVFGVMAGGQVVTPLPQAPQMLEVYVLAVTLGLLVTRARHSARPARRGALA